MFERSQIIDQNFQKFFSTEMSVAEFRFLQKHIPISGAQLVDLFESQCISRLMDIQSRLLKKIGRSYYTISSSGHEGLAGLAFTTRLTDMAFLHYRDCAFMVQRSKQKHGHPILHDLLLSFAASSRDPISGGRHKVLGHKDLFIPPQTSTIASHLPKAIGAALSVPRGKTYGLDTEMPDDSIIICTFGDASLNHASAQSAINTASWVSYQNIPLPLLYVCEDNEIGISVPTPPNWVKKNQEANCAIKYFECNGLDIVETLKVSAKAVEYVREFKKPAFLRLKTVRLLGHAGSDIETVYHSQKHIEEKEQQDPLLVTAKILLANRMATIDEINHIYNNLKLRIEAISQKVGDQPTLTTAQEIMEPILPKKLKRKKIFTENPEKRQRIFGADWNQLIQNKHPLNKLINFALTDLLLDYPETLIFGEDVAKKGGVYNVTSKLERRFGRKRIFNSPLDETSILGTAVGFAHNGFVPIPEIQFLAYYHNAQDQLRGEAATLSFFSNQQFTNGMVVRIAGLAYQKGFGGHYHNDNSITVFRDLPGVQLACPSNGADAVRMIRACVREAYEYGRIFIFLEPIALYPVRDVHEDGDGDYCFSYPVDTKDEIAVGEFNVMNCSGPTELTIITYGNGVYLSLQAAKELFRKNIKVKIIDLRWLTMIDYKKLSTEIAKDKHVLIVDECRRSGSLSEEIMTNLFENLSSLPKLKRLCAEDSFIPLGKAANLTLPSKESIYQSCLKLLGKA
ncbi:thiamine pyrophosphate-dependent enzyme [Bacteriovoracaceae bacterium]|nr:thiamine pyrophosphate-dependent enzyme [Bacteriovoracaceae bacterium]